MVGSAKQVQAPVVLARSRAASASSGAAAMGTKGRGWAAVDE